MTNTHMTIDSPITQAINETFNALHDYRAAEAQGAPSHILAMLQHDLRLLDQRRKTLQKAKLLFALN
jgi:hypothetical protein